MISEVLYPVFQRYTGSLHIFFRKSVWVLLPDRRALATLLWYLREGHYTLLSSLNTYTQKMPQNRGMKSIAVSPLSGSPLTGRLLRKLVCRALRLVHVVLEQPTQARAHILF